MRRWCLALGLVAAGGCRGPAPSSSTLQVFAASSLTEAFTDIERGFEAANPGIDIVTTFAGSQVLRLQIEQGAPAHVFASANADHMTALADAGIVADSEEFAHNELVVIVPAAAAGAIDSFIELPDAERVVLGSPEVPVGAYAREVLARADDALASAVRAHVVSEESNVRLVRAKVEMGEADAALVYRTDAVGSDLVRIVEIPPDLAVHADYVIGRIAHTSHGDLAIRFLDYVGSDEGRAILTARGFATDE